MQTIADFEYANEIDPDAPYGRKKNGQPYKTKPSMRNAIKNYQSKHRAELSEKQRKYYQANAESCKEVIRNWQKTHPERYNEIARKCYYNKKYELEYLRELFNQGLQMA